MPKKKIKIFVIAGEASGDWLGSKLIREIKALNPNVEITGIGGKKMKAQGMESLFPITELSLMGFAEILPHIPRLKRRISQTIRAIEKYKPDVLVTIDSPGFNFRVVRQLQQLRKKSKFVHYVAPTVWAYKPERAAKTAGIFDMLLTILPFEPPYFEKEGLKTEFIGHPVIEDGLDKGDAKAFMERNEIKGDFICLMPGSRKGELKRMLPVFGRVMDKMQQQSVILAADNMKLALEAATKKWSKPPIIIDNTERADCFAACKAGLIKSGTAGLEFSFAGKPYVVAYRVNPLSAYMMRKMIRTDYVNLVNILLKKELITELLQEDCEATYIAENLQVAIEEAEDIKPEIKRAIDMLRPESDKLPSARAAELILKSID